MNVPFGEQTITANTTLELSQVAATILDTGYAAGATSRHGEASITVDATTGKFTCVAGIYEFAFNASVEAAETSGSATSGDTQGEIIFGLYQAGTVVAGSKAIVEIDTVGAGRQVVVRKIVEVTEAQQEAGTNYFQIGMVSTDSSGNDLLIKEGRFGVLRLN